MPRIHIALPAPGSGTSAALDLTSKGECHMQPELAGSNSSELGSGWAGRRALRAAAGPRVCAGAPIWAAAHPA